MAGIVPIRKRASTGVALVPFRMRKVGPDVLLTSPWGDWVFVTEQELDSLASGTLQDGTALHAKLSERGFLRDGVDAAALAERVSRRKRFLDAGPNLHILIPTLRCNQTCVYCHASRADMSDTSTDMTQETADKVVDFIFQSTSPRITIEFQGGEPLANFPLVKYVIERAKDKNQQEDKTLEFTLVSNLSLLDDEKLDYLVANKVQVCTSVDGPATLHDKQRVLASGSSHAEAVRWIKRINARYEEMGLDPVLYHVEALITTTRAALAMPKQIVDTYVDLGCRAIFLRPVDPFGFAAQTGKTIEYDRAEFLDFYREAVGHILALNKQGTQVLERYAAIFLTKILGDDDPNYLDIRSPCGAGIGQLAYNHDGKIFTCDEGRMVHQMGDSFFQIGKVGETRYRQVMLSDTVRALTVASNLDAQPDCVACVYNPYCGVCPVHSYATQGSIFGRMRESSWCAVHKGIQDFLFEMLHDNDPETVDTLRRWTTIRERAHFVQPRCSE
jgi:His-Xaa-Ser system radical SAM maturase HxsB